MSKDKKEEVEIFSISEFTFIDYVAASNGVGKKSLFRVLIPYLLIIFIGSFLFGAWALVQKYIWSIYLVPFFLSIGLLVPCKEFFAIKNGEQDSISVTDKAKSFSFPDDRIFCTFVDNRIEKTKKNGARLLEVLVVFGFLSFLFMVSGLTYHFIDKLLESTFFYIWITGSFVSFFYYMLLKFYQCYYLPFKQRKSKEVFTVNLIRLGIVPLNKRLTEFKLSNGDTIEGTILFELYFDPYPLSFLELVGGLISITFFSFLFIIIHFVFYRDTSKLNEQDKNYIKALSNSSQMDIAEVSSILRQFIENVTPYMIQKEVKEKLFAQLKIKSSTEHEATLLR